MNLDDLIGKKYEKNGRGPDEFDCWGVCLEVCRRIGIYLPEVEELSNEPFEKVDKPKVGDVVFIKMTEEGHAGVMINNSSFLQVISTGNRGVHRMKINHPWVKDRIEGFYRYAG
jgi:cell wall-associated NlpC family hydrolase